jgi:NAD(P)-dependent dehydrogenase (short-subunit alcohol dehydrogenase family)
MKTWTLRDIPSQRGRSAVITGATGGLGYETALALAGVGAQVVLTGRNAVKGAAALESIRAACPGAVISYETLDLGSLASIQDFAERFKRSHDALDILVNNGGVMAPPTRHVTADGFELQFGTNYLSHFALTAQLLPLLTQGRQARVVNLSSMAHRFGASIHFDDLNGQRRYKAFAAYGQSKLAMLMFTFELQRRSDEHGWGLLSLAAHPGLAATALLQNGQRLGGNGKAGWIETFSGCLPSVLAQSAGDGALPTLYAATSPNAARAGYYGPTGFMELKGSAGEATVAPRARDQAVAARLWAVSERLTGVHWAAAPVMVERSFV